MLSYRHGFHAGNLADMLKHSVLIATLAAMKRKTTAMSYLESHAGAALYDLQSPTARTTMEWRSGIGAIWSRANASDAPTSLRSLIAINGDAMSSVEPERYHGSAAIAARLLDANDRIVLAELHPADHAQLQEYFANDRRAFVHKQDGYALLRAQLPPKHTRALTLIDPAYELPGESDRVLDALKDALMRFERGVYLAWYPLRGKIDVQKFVRRARALSPRKAFVCELRTSATERAPLGSGLLVLNPPYQLEDEITSLLAWFERTLPSFEGPSGEPMRGKGHFDWLVR